MKNYNEMAESVLKRRDKYIVERKKHMKRVTSILSCFCLVTLLAVGIWHTGMGSEHTTLDAGIDNEQLDGNPSGYNTQDGLEHKENNTVMMPDNLSEIGETDPLFSDTPHSYTDAPVQGEPNNTGALIAYEEVWGGSYMDQNGCWVIWLTENTPENQKKVFERNPDLLKSNTTFKTADYSHAYLTELLANISEGMGDGKLPYVTTASLMEQINRIEVTMTTDDADSVAKVLSFDKMGGAIEIRYASDYIKGEVLEKSSAE